MFCLVLFLLIYSAAVSAISGYFSHRAAVKINKTAYAPAIEDLERALGLIPLKAERGPFSSDLGRIHRLLGKAWLSRAHQEQKVFSDYDAVLKKAFDHFMRAHTLNPDDIKPAKGLAMTADLLEKAFSKQFPGRENPHNALPFYRRLSQLRPNGLTVHYMIARCLHDRGLNRELSTIVRHIAMLCPQDTGNGDLKKESFYSPALDDAVEKGIEDALDRGVFKRQAGFAMAKVMEAQSRPVKAAFFYQKAMGIETYRNNAGHFIRLGALFLKTSQFEKAGDAFEKGLARAEDFKGSFQRIFRMFHKQGADRQFIEFVGHLDKKSAAQPIVALCIARSRMALGLDELARAGLLRLVSDHPGAEAYYLLALIAEKQEQWDAMEISIQKATVLDPGKCRYYHKFAKALSRQGKQVQADIQRTRAGQCSASTPR